MTTIRIGVAGAGRMGLAVANGVLASPRFELAGVWARDAAGAAGKFPGDTVIVEAIDALAQDADVLIDFSLPAATPAVAEAARARGVPLVSGVTGLTASGHEALATAGRVVPVVYGRNMSQGIALLKRIVGQAVESLGDEFCVTIEETHHLAKRDAPSGTALSLGETVARHRGQAFEAVKWYEPSLDPATAPDDAIRIVVERRGDVVGDHSVSFESDMEALTLRHHAATRDVFAAGALRAAAWVIGRAPGVYGMRDVIGEKTGAAP